MLGYKMNEKETGEVLHDISLRIMPGETIAFVGSSGGGKTTLSQLIPRFYDVTDGAVYIDGQDVRKVTQESLHQNIGVVQQEVFLFASSIGDNIRYGRLDATMQEVDEATSALDSVTEAKIQKTFEKLSAGRTTIVIAHRLSTVKNANRIAVIDNGNIIELGSHDELMENNGFYAALVGAQELKE